MQNVINVEGNMTTSTNPARKTWTKPTVTDVELVTNTRAGSNARPSGEVMFYNPLS